MKKRRLFFTVIIVLTFSILHIACPPFPVNVEDNTIGDDHEIDQEAEENYEPNNNYQEATIIEIGETQYHTIKNKDDIDYLKFLCESGKTYRINMFDINYFYPEMELFDTNGTTSLEMKNVYGGYTEEYNWYGRDADGIYIEEEKESIIFEAVSNEYYYVAINDTYHVNEDGNYKIRITEIINVSKTDSLTALPNRDDLGINLSWDIIDGVDGYRLYKTTDPSDFANFTHFHTITDSSVNNYTDTYITLDTEYSYILKGYIQDVYGDRSNVASAVLTITVGTSNDLTADADPNEFQINLEWKKIVDASGYYIYKTDTPQDIANPNYNEFSRLITITDNNILTYNDIDVEPNTAYYYYVTGYYAVIEGNPSNVDDAMFNWSEFVPPSGLVTASEDEIGFIRLTLEKKYNNTNIISYKIYRSDTNENYDSLIEIGSFDGTAPINSTLNDNSVSSGTYYHYCIKIVMEIGASQIESQYSIYDSGYSH